MSIKDSYDSWASSYDTDRNLTRDLDETVTRNALATMRCHSIIEAGCGTGKNTTLFAAIGQQVHALDFSSGMLEVARNKLTAANVTFTVADITKPWPCQEHGADLVACNLVLEHIADIAGVFAHASRALRDGGTIFVCELHPFRQYLGTKANFQRQQAIEIPAFVHHISDFLRAAEGNGLTIERLDEWWHPQDEDKPPRLVSFMFGK